MQTKPLNCNWLTRIVTVLAVAVALIGCAESVPPKVVVYTSVGRELALPIFARFTKQTGIKVHAAYGSDYVESAKLARDIVAHGAQSRADVYWNREIFDTLWLEREGKLRSFTSPDATYFSTDSRSASGTWYAVASDARVLVVNTRQIAEARLPKSIRDLTDPQWYERTAIARPTHSAAGTHAACIFQAWGDAPSQEFFLAVKRNARIFETDREVAHSVAVGSLAFGLTNASDAVAEISAGAPLVIVYPDQGDGELGALFIPSTVALIKDSPDGEPAERLLNHLLSAEVAEQLANGPNALVPARAGVAASNRVKTPAEVRVMNADFPAAAASWGVTSKFLEAEFAAGD